MKVKPGFVNILKKRNDNRRIVNFNFPAVTIREAHECPEGIDIGTLIMSVLDSNIIVESINIVTSQFNGKDRVFIKLLNKYGLNIFFKNIDKKDKKEINKAFKTLAKLSKNYNIKFYNYCKRKYLKNNPGIIDKYIFLISIKYLKSSLYLFIKNLQNMLLRIVKGEKAVNMHYSLYRN